MPFDKRVDKRVELFSFFSTDHMKKLSDKVQDLKKPDKDGNKKLLNPMEVKKLIELYQNCAIEIKNTYDKKKKNKENTGVYKKAMKKLSKDYIALLRYQKRLEKKPETAKWTIEDFYEKSKTKTITMDVSEFANLQTAGAGQSTRLKVSFLIDDEPVEGKKKGDSCTGFFTQGELKNPHISNKERFEFKQNQVIRDLAEKYPGTRDFLDAIKDDWSAVRDNKTKDMYDLMRNRTECFGTMYSMQDSKKIIADAIKTAHPNRSGLQMAKRVESIDSEEKFAAYKEYVSTMLKEEFAMGVRGTLGIPETADHGKRNAMTSSLADYFGCGDAFAFSEKMKIKVKDGNRSKTMTGIMMMPAKGVDPATAGSTSDYSNVTRLDYEDSPDAVKNIAQIQFLDYLLGNPDRHVGNLFIQINEKTKKVAGAQAIDNDTCGGTRLDAHTEMSGVSFSKLRVIPKTMADAVLNTKPEMFAVLMQGYDLSDNEITVQTAKFMDVKKKLEYCQKAYEGVEEGYLDPDIPRIVPDDKIVDYKVSEQLAYTPKNNEELRHSNLFGKLTKAEGFLGNKFATVRNDKWKCMSTATEIKEIMNVDMKNSLKNVKEYAVVDEPVERRPGYKLMTNTRDVSDRLKTAYDGMIAACDVLNKPEYKMERLIEPQKSSEDGGYDYTARLKTEVKVEKKAEKKEINPENKETVKTDNKENVKPDDKKAEEAKKVKTLKDLYLEKLADAIKASQNYIDELYEEIGNKMKEVNDRKEQERKNKKKSKKAQKPGQRVVVKGDEDANKYDRYVSAKAFMDYYEKNLGKESEEYKKEKALYEKLGKDKDVKMVEAAVKNREALIKAYEKFEALDQSMASLKAGIEDLNKKLGVEIKKEEKNEIKPMQDPYVESGYGRKARKYVRDHKGGAAQLEANLKKMKLGRINLDTQLVNVGPEKKQLLKK